MKQKYYLALTAEEWRLMIESLNNLRNRLISEGRYTDAVNEVLIKVTNALRMLRVLLDGEKHSAAEMAETELIPMQFAYQILRKLSAGELVQVSRGAAGGCRLSCDLRGVSLYDLMAVMGEHDVLCACMEPGYDCRWQSEHGKCAIHCQLTELQRKQDEAFRAVSLHRLLTGEAIQKEEMTQQT